jgi:UDP-N-acetylmuramate--alanine ligase
LTKNNIDTNKIKSEQLDYLLANPVGKNFHFIGIGGISMSGLAMMLANIGAVISGSDICENIHTDKLKKMGFTISKGHNTSNITTHPEIDAVIYTAAIAVDNDEYTAAQDNGLLLIDRATLLGAIMKQFSMPITVSGTHGKSTTTSMVSSIFLAADKDPTIHNGSNHSAIGGNIRIGNSDIFISEACEYKDSFLKFFPYIAIILNVEIDHVDYFKSVSHYLESYRQFVSLVPEDGCVIAWADDPDMSKVLTGLKCKIISYSVKDPTCNYYATDISFDKSGFASYTLFIDGIEKARIKLSVPGLHNVQNSLASAAAAICGGCNIIDIVNGLLAFTGTDKRYELKGIKNGITVIDDYAHHPTEIRATISAAKNSAKGKIWCVFQPHTYTRLKEFEADFADSLMAADGVIVAGVFAAREAKVPGVTPKNLCNRLLAAGKEAYYIEDFGEIALLLSEKTVSGDMIIILGAGDIVEVANIFLKQ